MYRIAGKSLGSTARVSRVMFIVILIAIHFGSPCEFRPRALVLAHYCPELLGPASQLPGRDRPFQHEGEYG
jgi:hypothetical protein